MWSYSGGPISRYKPSLRALNSSILAWRTPGMVEPGGLLSLGHRVRHDWSDLAAAAARALNMFKAFHWESRTPVPVLNTVMGGQSAMTDLTARCEWAGALFCGRLQKWPQRPLISIYTSLQSDLAGSFKVEGLNRYIPPWSSGSEYIFTSSVQV